MAKNSILCYKNKASRNFEAEVILSTFMGSYQLYELELFGNKFTIHENNPKTKRIYEIGEKAKIELDISDIHII